MNTFVNSDEKLSKYMLRKVTEYWGLRTPTRDGLADGSLAADSAD